jgi:uncharacterized surface protein with fasciclin (FAS1) repeats
MKRILVVLQIFVIAFGVQGAAAQSEYGTLAEVLKTLSDDPTMGVSAFYELVEESAPELLSTLDGAENSYTLFVPTDAAVSQLDKLLEDDEATSTTLVDVSNFHVIEGAFTLEMLAELAMGTGEQKTLPLKTLQGQYIDAQMVNGALRINDAKLVKYDIRAANGVIHIIDVVAIPENQTIDGAVKRLAESETPELTRLVDAVGTSTAQLLAEGDKEYTLFAPSDAAFEAAGVDAILTYSIAIGAYSSRDLAALIKENRQLAGSTGIVLKSATEDSELLLTLDREGQMYINGAKIIRTDIDAANGYIHIIDRVMDARG